MTDDLVAQVDTSVAHIARVYNYWLGGKDHFTADREAAELVVESYPTVLVSVRAQREFLGRAVRWPRSPGSSTWTTTRSCWRTHAPC